MPYLVTCVVGNVRYYLDGHIGATSAKKEAMRYHSKEGAEASAKAAREGGWQKDFEWEAMHEDDC